ncbi:hypothetical protein Tco_0136630 [Tanacetum coccineum]
MEEASLLTQKHLFITTTDKHWVPPTKRLFKVAMLDPSPNLLVHEERLEIRDYQLCEWSTPAGLKLTRENLQCRVKEEDSITEVENAIFDLGVMDSLCFFFIDQRVFIGMITKFVKFIELNFPVITRSKKIKVCLFQGPIGFVLKLDRKMASLSIHKLVRLRSTPDGCFVSCAEGP